MRRIAEERRIGIVLISSELEELIRCANRVVTIYDGRLTRDLGEDQIDMGLILSSIIGATPAAA